MQSKYRMSKTTQAGTRLLPGQSLIAALFLLACDSADLPPGWEDATRIEDFTQKQCKGSSEIEEPEAVTATGRRGVVSVDYSHAPFRCSQDVEGYLRRSSGKLDVLVQPVDMDPDSVAKCSCRYDIVAEIPAKPGLYTVTVHQRGDHKSGRDLYVVGSDDARVPENE